MTPPDGQPTELPEIVWARSAKGDVKGFHKICADWLGLTGKDLADLDKAAGHTEICVACGRFLEVPPTSREGKPPFDPKIVLS
ncbi:MAG: hypothetical protein JO247_21780 [Chloroflexi bacterium]|nr:hypothetical protein [Chloroflexota bacterium]